MGKIKPAVVEEVEVVQTVAQRSEPTPKATVPVVKIKPEVKTDEAASVPARKMRVFDCGNLTAVSNGNTPYVALNGRIELPDDESWYGPMIMAGILVEVA